MQSVRWKIDEKVIFAICYFAPMPDNVVVGQHHKLLYKPYETNTGTSMTVTVTVTVAVTVAVTMTTQIA